TGLSNRLAIEIGAVRASKVLQKEFSCPAEELRMAPGKGVLLNAHRSFSVTSQHHFVSLECEHLPRHGSGENGQCALVYFPGPRSLAVEVQDGKFSRDIVFAFGHVGGPKQSSVTREGR